MAKISDLIDQAEGAARAHKKKRKREELKLFELSSPENFPKTPKNATEEIRLQMRELALTSLYYMTKTVLGYTKLRVEPHGEFCAYLDFIEKNQPDFNRDSSFMPRDTYKTTIATIARAIQRGCKDPNTRGLILADTGQNATRFGMEIKNQFQFNTFLQWLFPDRIPENFNTTRWNANELVLKRTAPWREPTFDMMGAQGGIESRHYDWIIADDLVTQKHKRSDVEMDRLTNWVNSLESLLVNDVESQISFVGSRKKKGDTYEHILRYYGAEGAEAKKIGPHAELRGSIAVYARKVIEDGKIIFPYSKELKSGISAKFIQRLRAHDPERYNSEYANDPKGDGLTWFNTNDLRWFRVIRDKLSGSQVIEAMHNNTLIERVFVSSLEIIAFYDPSVAKKQTSSKQALHVVAKGSGPNRYVLESKIGHFPPDEMMLYLWEVNERWRPEFFSIEERGFQGWVKYSLDLISELQNLPTIPVATYPPLGSVRGSWAKPEHIRSLQPVIKNHLLWLNEGDPAQTELASDIEFYPNVRWDDALDALAQGTEWWPFSIDEAALAAKREGEIRYLNSSLPDRFQSLLQEGEAVRPKGIFNEEDFLRQFDPSGYGTKTFNN